MDPTAARTLPYIVPLLFLALILRRNLRARSLRMERLWVYPAILVLATGSAMYNESPPGLVSLIGFAVALAAGGLVGWYRGRLTRITIDPATHEFTSQASVAGTLLIGVVFALRYGVKMAMTGGGASMPMGGRLDVAGITDGLMLFAVGMMSVQRVEMYLRCQKLLSEARGGGIVA
jgi:hypothetical protein